MVVQISRGERAEWIVAHEALSRLAKARAGAEFEEGQWLLAALRSAVHVHLGYSTFGEYVERLFGYNGRFTREKLRVAEALEQLPKTGEALATGAINWTVARELTRVVLGETEEQWLQAAQGRTARQVEALVAGKALGDKPDSPSRKDALRRVLRFDVSPEAFATVREAIAKLRRTCDFELDDSSALLLMARTVLGGPSDAGQSSYQIAMTVCEGCGKGFQQSQGELIEVGPALVEMAGCDAQHIGALHETEADATPGGRPARASQTIPPAIRRKVMRRDHGRCVIPGCRCVEFLDVHHIKLRSEGGDHDPDNLVLLCGAHHAALHEGKISIIGRVSTGLQFVRADGTRYEEAPSPQTVDTFTKLFGALRRMGFGEAATRRALARVREMHATELDTLDMLLRKALAVLTDPAPPRSS